MKELFANERVKFKSDKFRLSFWSELERKAPLRELAKQLHCSERTVRDWKRGKYLPAKRQIEFLCEKYQVKLSFHKVTLVSVRDQKQKAGKVGGSTVVKKYGRVPTNEQARKIAWRQWWEQNGRFDQERITSPQPILLPDYCDKLAEFVGIMIGDGTVAPYHIAIFLNTKSDQDYIKYVSQLIIDLFGVQPKKYNYPKKSITALTVARKSLVTFLCSLGLPQGNKLTQGVQIPGWIYSHHSFGKHCLRGLFDTDGSVYVHQYQRNGKTYRYIKINFTSASPILLSEVQQLLHSFQIRSSVYKTSVVIGAQVDVQRFAHLIGSSNQKHLKRLP